MIRCSDETELAAEDEIHEEGPLPAGTLVHQRFYLLSHTSKIRPETGLVLDSGKVDHRRMRTAKSLVEIVFSTRALAFPKKK